MTQDKGKKNTVKIAQELALPVLEQLGLELWDVRFEKEGAGWYLRYFVDKPEGVGIADLEAFSRVVDKLLDQADPIEQSYTLEVCSPGVERKLTKDAHFQRYIGEMVTVRTIRPVDGVREFTGILAAKEGDDIRLRLDQEGGEPLEITFKRQETAYVKLYADFGTGGLE